MPPIPSQQPGLVAPDDEVPARILPEGEGEGDIDDDRVAVDPHVPLGFRALLCTTPRISTWNREG